MAEYMIQGDTLTGIADAIRGKTGKSDPIQTSSMAAEIQAIPTGGNELLDILNKTATSVDLPGVTKLYEYQFAYFDNLVSARFPDATDVSIYSFRFDAKLEDVELKKVGTARGNVFLGCVSLKKADYGSLKTIQSNAFNDSSVFDTLIIRSATLCELNSTSVFPSGCPIAQGTGHIYVPKVLIDTYKQATNWTVYADQIRAIEDYPEITGGAA